MRSVAIATVVVVLMVLRTAAYPDTTSPFTTTTSPFTTTTSPFTTTTACPLPPCSYLPGCGSYIGSDGCIHCGCNTCDNTSCAEGEKCELLPDDCWSQGAPCLPEPVCVSTTDTTTLLTTTPCTSGPTPMPHYPGCRAFEGPDGCISDQCYTCDELCGAGQECELQICWSYPCPPPAICGSTTDTTTPFTTTTETPTPTPTPTPFTTTPEMTTTSCPPLPPYARLPGYGTFIDQDGCLILKFYTCDEVCGVGQECQLQQCWDDPCLLPAVCGSTTDTTRPFTTTPQTTTSSCPPLPPFAHIPGCGPVMSPDGCIRIKCYTCNDISCDEGQVCELQICWSYPCPPLAVCVSTTDTTTPFTTTPEMTTTSCPPLPPYARNPGCGTFFNQDGCLTVQCFTCAEACGVAECELQQCWDDPCFRPAAVCGSKTATPPPPVSCQPVTCLPNCVSDVGPDGCTTCVCPRVCNMLCMIGYECVLVNVTCEQDPCFPEPQCVPKQETTTPPCRMYKCASNCVPGNGSDGCPTCECPPSCQTVKCSDGYECQLVNVTCKRDPCFPQPQCVAIKNPCTGTPNPRRCGRFRNRWTYNSVTDKCEKFRYYGCTPSLNTFLSPKACKNKCQGRAQSICEDVVCEKNCYTYSRTNKCPKCICPNPCEGFKCREGYECKLRESKCENKDPKPFCAKKS